MGCTFGKFSKTKKFKLHVTCLDYIAQYAQYKVTARQVDGHPAINAIQKYSAVRRLPAV